MSKSSLSKVASAAVKSIIRLELEVFSSKLKDLILSNFFSVPIINFDSAGRRYMNRARRSDRRGIGERAAAPPAAYYRLFKRPIFIQDLIFRELYRKKSWTSPISFILLKN